MRLAIILTVLFAWLLWFVGTHTSIYGIVSSPAVTLNDRVTVVGLKAPNDRFIATRLELSKPVPMWLALVGILIDGIHVSSPSEQQIPERYPKRLRLESDARRAALDAGRIAEVVAARASGFRVGEPRFAPTVTYVADSSEQAGILQAGDIIEAIAGRSVSDCKTALDSWFPSTVRSVPLQFSRDGRSHRLRVPIDHIFIFYCADEVRAQRLPVAVRGLNELRGDTGLVFALQLYESLHPRDAERRRVIAGAGELALDGQISAARFVTARVRAAERAGATVFLVPRDNYPEVAGARKIKIIPVSTFREAVAALDRLS